jgi:hypothetical protein
VIRDQIAGKVAPWRAGNAGFKKFVEFQRNYKKGVSRGRGGSRHVVGLAVSIRLEGTKILQVTENLRVKSLQLLQMILFCPAMGSFASFAKRINCGFGSDLFFCHGFGRCILN